MKQNLLNLIRLRLAMLVSFVAFAAVTAWGQTTVTQTSFSATSGNVSSDTRVTYAAYKGGGTTDPAINSNAIRLYQNSGGATGGYVVIGVTDGYVITSATIRSTMATTTGYMVSDTDPGNTTPEKTSFAVSNYSLSANSDYTVGSLSTKYVTFACFGTNTSSRLYVSKISVTYQETGSGQTYTVTLGDDSTELEETSVGGGVTLPVRDGIGSYTFAGWSTTNVATETTTAPTIISAGAYSPSDDITLYPVYTRTESSGGSSAQTASVTMSEYATANGWGSTSSDGQKTVQIDENVTATCNDGTNSGKYYTDWRIYQTETGEITVSTASGELTSVTFTFMNSNGGTLNYGSTVLTSGTAVSVSGSTAEFTVGNSGTASKGQIRITAISVNYNGTSSTTYYWSTPTGNVKTSTTTSFATASYSFPLNSAEYTAFTGQTATVSDGTNTVSGATIAYATTDADIAAVNSSTGAVTLGTKLGTATITATYAGDDDYTGSDASYTITLTYPYVHAGTEADPFTVAEGYAKAQEIGTTAAGPWYVKGIIAQIGEVSTSYGNAQYWISDDGGTTGNMIEIFRGKYLDNAAFTAEGQIQEGDEVVVTGNLVNYNGTTPEFAANNYIVSLSRGGLEPAEFSFPQASYTAVLGGTFTAPTLSTAAGYDGTPGYVSSNTGAATVDAATGAVTIVGVGTTTITASAAATSNFAADEASYTLTVVSKLSPELAVSPNTLTVTEGAADGSVTVTTASGYAGTISVSSDDTSVATATYSAGTITVVYGSTGTATLTVTAAADGDYEAQTQTVAVTVNAVSPTLWEEYFGSYSANDVPSGGTYSYTCTDGTSVTKIYTDALAGGEAPELLVGKAGGSFEATIPLNGYYGTFTLTYKANNTNLAVTSSVGTVGSATNTSDKTYQLQITDVPEGTTSITITFANSKSSNTRLDNIVLESETTPAVSVSAPTFNPESGAVTAGTTVTISSEAGTVIKYTTDGSDPTTSATAVTTSGNTATVEINTSTTIRAVAMDDDLNISAEATAGYTIRSAGVINLTRQLVFLPATSGLSSTNYASNDDASEMSGTFAGDSEVTAFGGFTFKDTYISRSGEEYYIQMKANTGAITFPTINSAFGFDVAVDYATNDAVTTIDDVEATGTSATAATLKIATGDKYCRINSITITPRVEGKISVTLAEVEIGSDKVYAGTYYNPTVAYIMPDGMTGYTITAADGNGGALTLNSVYASGSEVPVAEPLLITSATSQSNVALTLVTSPTTTSTNGNLLKGSPGAGVMISGDTDHYYYKLSKSKSTGKPGFFWGNATGEPFEMAKATSCYLEVAKPASGDPMRGFSFGTDFATAISLVSANGGTMPQAIYDLQGRRVAKVQKGIYIVNGKKVMVK